MAKTLRTASIYAFLLLLLSTALYALGPTGTCGGSYYIEEDGGARDVWTFGSDGTFFGTTSTQPLIGFSDQQGTWTRKPRGGKGVLITFVFAEDRTLLTVGRVDIELEASDANCDSIRGSLSVRTFEDGEDPLDPATDTGDPIAEDTFIGRRIQVPGDLGGGSGG